MSMADAQKESDLEGVASFKGAEAEQEVIETAHESGL
jgi:hypothetical protein